MKNLQVLLLIIGVIAFSNCSNSDNKTDTKDNPNKLTEFFSGFKNLKLPLSSSNIERGKKIETKFLDILTDTTGKLSRNYPDGELHFNKVYFRVGKIESLNKNYKIIITADIPTTATFDLMEGALYEYKLLTFSPEGKKIAELLISNVSSDGKSWGKSCKINKNLEIEVETSSAITTYKIESDGKITKVSEKAKSDNIEFQNFIKKSYKSDNLTFYSKSINDIENMSNDQIKYVENVFGLSLDMYNNLKSVVFKTKNYIAFLFLYGNGEKSQAYLASTDSSGKIISKPIYLYRNDFDAETFYEGGLEIKPAENDMLKIRCFQKEYDKKDEKNIAKQREVKYFKIYENGKITEINNLGKKQGTVTAVFTNFEQRDGIMYYFFKTETSDEYYFNQLPENCTYELVYQDADNPEGFIPEEYQNKTFEIDFHSDKAKGDLGVEIINFYYIDKIKMLSK